MFKILIVEDDKNTSKLMQVILRKGGYDVLTASNGTEALKILDTHFTDLILLDIMMPEMDGFEFAHELRKNGNNIPIIMITAKPLVEDKIEGFKAGVDDYMVKPVNEEELLLRIKALMRRYKIASEQKLSIGEINLDYANLTVSRGDEIYTLPKKEFYLLFKLLSHPGQIFTRIQLMDEIWGLDTNSGDTTVNVHINRIRKRFSDFTEFKIVAIKGVGYKSVITNEEK